MNFVQLAGGRKRGKQLAVPLLSIVGGLLVFVVTGPGAGLRIIGQQTQGGLCAGPQPCSLSLDTPGGEAVPPGVGQGRGVLVSPGEAAAFANLSRWSPHERLGPRSSKFEPVVLSACTEDMPDFWAPCMVGATSNPTLAYGEEVLYPAFSIPEPNFIEQEHRDWWRSMATDYAPDRYRLRNGRAVYLDQHGQNLVLRNVRFNNMPPTDTWSPNACMAAGVSHRGLQPLPAGTEPQWDGRAVLINPPDSWSYQHCLDRSTKMLVQTEGWREMGTRVVAGRQPNSAHTMDLWNTLLEAGSQEAVFGAQEFSAKEVIFSCRTPLMHPYLNERVRELMQLPKPAPLAQRKVVLYFSRNSADNGGKRKVINEDAVLDVIRGVLKERDRGEELVVYSRKSFSKIADLAAYMAANVSAIVGPHGGALYNCWWAARGTMMLEIYPRPNIGTLFWEESSVIGLQYWMLPTLADASNLNMAPDPALVGRILREQLGKEPEADEPQLFSEWSMSQMQT